ncbi:MAG: hypothetical protein NTY08_07930 [Proteobacteria bacterium]|nr:hypothetical protein [Pseudomonadota bacterium]
MRHTEFFKVVMTGLTMTVLAVATAAKADTSELAQMVKPWSTSTHIGYATNDQSSTGFRQAGGSVVLLDVSRPINSHIDIGLRSIASGAEDPSHQFYRLGAGPLVSYNINQNWAVQGAIAFFNEAGVGLQGQKSYQSRGQEVLLGWERIWRISRRIELAGGSFATYHHGTMSALAESRTSGLAAGATAIIDAKINRGISHGAELALRLRL